MVYKGLLLPRQLALLVPRQLLLTL